MFCNDILMDRIRIYKYLGINKYFNKDPSKLIKTFAFNLLDHL